MYRAVKKNICNRFSTRLPWVFSVAYLKVPMLVAVFCVFVLVLPGYGDKIPIPPALPPLSELVSDSTPQHILRCFSGTAYRPDGAIDHLGNFTLFADPQARLTTPGLNCSGFVVASCRYLFKRNYHLDAVIHDRLADSAADAALGEDWDFGYDLILNLTEGLPRRVVLPYGQRADIATSNGADLRGFQLHDLRAWRDVMAQMTASHIYLFSMSKPLGTNNSHLVHDHVGLVIPDDHGHLWFAHATRMRGVTVVDIATVAGLKSVVETNPDSAMGKRMILVLEVGLPK